MKEYKTPKAELGSDDVISMSGAGLETSLPSGTDGLWSFVK